MPPVVADRARKARKASRLSCGHYVVTGHLICHVGGHWVCSECLFAARERGENPVPEYEAMIRRDDEDGPDPLIPEPLGAPPDSRPLGIPERPKAPKKPKHARKGK